MPTGLSGDSTQSVGGESVPQATLIEMRVLSNLIQSLLGPGAYDELNVLRVDQAFELGLPPVPGQTT